MNMDGKNLQTVSNAQNCVKGYEKRGFSVVSGNPQNRVSLLSLAQLQPGPFHSRKARYRDVSNLKPWQVENLHLANAHAIQIGAPLDTFVTIAWLLTQCGQLEAHVFQLGMKRMCQWLKDNRSPVAWTYVHENPLSIYGDEKPNTHILLHVPQRLRCAFKAKLGGWFDALDGGVKGEPRTYRNYSGPDRLQYMCKGADFWICKNFGGHRSIRGQGIVSIKRSGVSQNLNRKARQVFTTTVREYARARGAA